MRSSGPPVRRTPLRAKKGLTSITPLRRTGPPKPMSAKRMADMADRTLVRIRVLARDRTCRAEHLVPEVRCGPAGAQLDVHEIIPRSAWAAGYLIPDNCIAVCRWHHQWIDDHPEQDGPAHRLGLHGFSWERPDHQGEP